MAEHLRERERDDNIPITQSAYRGGRSTTENVFTFKVLIEKAMTSSNNEVNILLLDMSKAFVSVNRRSLMNDLQSVLEPGELHILKVQSWPKVTGHSCFFETF
jgi:hypothetical protein